MSDQGTSQFSSGSENLSQSQGSVNNEDTDGFLNNKHVTFNQKKVLLQFMVDHEELVTQSQKDESLWEPLVDILNKSHDGAVRSPAAWKKTWKLWCCNVQKRRNDLSITLLDLQLLKFLDVLTKSEYIKSQLKNFSNDPEKTINSEQLQSATQILANLASDDVLVALMNILKELEVKEELHRSNLDIRNKRFSELMSKKQELQNQIDVEVTNINQEETQTVIAISEKTEILDKIRNHLRPLYN